MCIVTCILNGGSHTQCFLSGMALLFWMLKHLGALKGFFAMKPAKRSDGIYTQVEVEAYVHMCVTQDAMRPLSGIGHMWVEEDERKSDDSKATLLRMSFDAERQVDMGYLTPCLLAVIDTRLYCGMRGGVNAAFGKTGEKTSTNQPEAIAAHDKFLRERFMFHYV